MRTKQTKFEGHYFVVCADRDDWQGQVLSEIAPGVFLVQLYSWIDGEPTDRRVVEISAMASWRFYETAAQWREAGSAYSARRGAK